MSNGTIKVTIDQKSLDDYTYIYMVEHPKTRKPPIDRPLHPLMNTWTIMKRPQANALKQKWKDYICWLMQEKSLDGMGLESVEIEVISYFPTRRRVDPDNTVPKFILDGFTECGFLADDSGFCIKALTLKTGYDKENPRTEIVVNILEDLK